MRSSLILASLLSTVALPSFAQSVPGTPTTRAAPARAPAAAPQQTPLPRLARQGLTDNPIDVGRLQLGNGSGFVSNGGVTAKAPGGGNIIEEDAPKSRSTVTRDAIDKQPPTANPYQLIALSPGANVTSTDAFGLNGGNITVRGFNSDQIGLTIEGAPINDSGNYALFPQEYVDAPNIGQASLAQGTPDLDSPHIGATGGVLNVYMRDPAKTAGAFASQAIGSHRGTQTFGRVDTGQIGNFRAFASFSHYERHHWTGPGQDNRNHFDFKAVYDFDAQNKVSISAIYNEAVNNFYVAPTKAAFAANNRNFLSFLPGTAITGPDQSVNSASNFYKYRINPFRNLILSAPSSFTPMNNLTYDVIPYLWFGYGSGGGVSALKNGSVAYGNTSLGAGSTFNTTPGVTNTLYYNPSITETYRPGIINKLTYQWGDHKLVAGYWLEYASHKQTAPYIRLKADGTIADPFGGNSDGIVVQTGPYAGRTLQRRDALTQTTTHTLFAGDTWSLMNDRLILEFGVKQAFINRDVKNKLPGATSFDINSSATLPQAGIRYKINNENQVFASVGTTFRSPANFTYFDQFSLTSGAVSQRGNPNAKNEEAVTVEVGHRYQGDIFVTSATVFGTKYRNRQVTTSIIDGGGTISSTLNAGRVTSYGVDGEIGTKPIWGGWTAYVSGELLKTRLEDNLMTVGKVGALNVIDYLPTKGKNFVRAPSHQGAVSIAYDDTQIFGGVSVKYVSNQYSTFTNDEQIKAFGKVDAVLGYRFKDQGALKKPEIKLNLHNILDKRTLTGVSGVQTNALSTIGVNGSTISGSSPTYYQGEGFAAIVTFSGAY